ILSRFWELGVGAGLYAVLAHRGFFEPNRNPLPEKTVATYLGLALIFSGFMLGNSSNYPIPIAILPVAGTALVILGLHARIPQSVGSVLLTMPLVLVTGTL